MTGRRRTHPEPRVVVILAACACIGVLGSLDVRGSSASVGKPDRAIAFQRKLSKAPLSIYLMNRDGSGQRLLTPGSGFKWSPDGERIAFLRRTTGTFFDLWIINRDGGGLRKVVSDLLFGGLTWSPDGKHIAFEGKVGTTFPVADAIYVVDSDGRNLTRLTAASRSADVSSPRWSPDGAQIAFLRDEGDDRETIVTMTPNGSDQRILFSAYSLGPVRWSPNGLEIAFAAARTNRFPQYDIYVMDRRGTKLRNLTRTAQSDESGPDWSPNGRLIAFESYVGFKGHIRRMTHDGRDTLTLDLPKTNGFDPTWSPDGQSIIFISRRDGNQDIYAVTASGRNQTNLTNSRLPTQDTAPAWMP